jgi:hypothetical protein
LGQGQFPCGIPPIFSEFRQFLAAAVDLAMVPRVGPQSDKRPSSRTSHGEWLVNVSDDVVAPMTTLELIDALRKGRLSEEALVWRTGMRNWTALLDVPQLRLAAGSRPPPASDAPAADLAPTAAAPQAEHVEPPEEVNSAEYVDSPEHFESVDDSELEEGDEPVTTLMREPAAAAALALQSSLAPTTASTGAPAAWGHIDELLAGERRAEQHHTRRIVLWAALGSAVMAAAFTLFVVRSPANDESGPAQADQPSNAPSLSAAPVAAPTASIEALASASASAAALPRPAPKWGAPRFARRPKHAGSITPAGDAPDEAAPAADATMPAPTVAVVPAAPAEPAPPASAAIPSSPAPTSAAP